MQKTPGIPNSTSLSWWEHEVTARLFTLLVYVGVMTLTFFAESINIFILAFAGGVLICIYGSLQHESIHFPLFGKGRFDRLIVGMPLSLILSYDNYKRSHIEHHKCPELTSPAIDPESFYWHKNDWQKLPAPIRWLYKINHTLVGRLIVGPWLYVTRFLYQELKLVVLGDKIAQREWAWHGLLLIPVLAWLIFVANMPVWKYLLCFTWPGLSLTLLRSYAEHRRAPSQAERTVIIEGSWFTRLLFLNNNYHAVHHNRGELPWYKLRREYLIDRNLFLERNGGYYFRGYHELFKRYGFSCKDSPVII